MRSLLTSMNMAGEVREKAQTDVDKKIGAAACNHPHTCSGRQ